LTVRYKLGCQLSYEVRSPTVFIFNIEVAKLLRHQELVESLTISPDISRRIYEVPDVRNRYFSVEAKPGPLEVRYEAEVTLEVFRADPVTIGETPLAQVPLDIIPAAVPFCPFKSAVSLCQSRVRQGRPRSSAGHSDLQLAVRQHRL
jgi:hypothetical protein